MVDIWNFIIGMICTFILGMAFHSTLGHSNYKMWLWHTFHPNEKPPCYGKYYDLKYYGCHRCNYREGCYKKWIG